MTLMYERLICLLRLDLVNICYLHYALNYRRPGPVRARPSGRSLYGNDCAEIAGASRAAHEKKLQLFANLCVYHPPDYAAHIIAGELIMKMSEQTAAAARRQETLCMLRTRSNTRRPCEMEVKTFSAFISLSECRGNGEANNESILRQRAAQPRKTKVHAILHRQFRNAAQRAGPVRKEPQLQSRRTQSMNNDNETSSEGKL